jgi:hypothetical protein
VFLTTFRVLVFGFRSERKAVTLFNDSNFASKALTRRAWVSIVA